MESNSENNHLLPGNNPTVPAARGSKAVITPSSSAYDYVDTVPDDQNRGGLLEYWQIVKRNKGTVIVGMFLGGLIGYLVTLPQTPVFQAKTTVEIENLNDNFLNIKQVNPTDTNSAQPADIQTQIKIIQSASLLQRVIGKLSEDQLPRTETGRVSAWRRALNLPDVAPQDSYETALKIAQKSLKVRNAGPTRIVEITVDSTDPKVAANFANTLANEYIEQSLSTRWQTTQKTTDWLSRQLDDMRIKLERSEDRLQQYARQAGLMFTSEKTNVSEDKLRQLQQALSAAQSDRITKQSRFEMANSSPPEALPDILGDSGIREYQSKLTELRRQMAELTTTFSRDYPKVKRTEAQIGIIQAAFERERGAILKRIQNEYEESLRRERLLAEDHANQTKLVSGEGERAIQYGILKREVDSNRQLYDTMLSQLKQATIASALRASNIRVVDPAEIPRRPYQPDAPLSAGIGLLGGLVLGIVFVVMRDRADRSIQQPGDTNYYLGIAELGIIPAAESRSLSLLRYGPRHPEKQNPNLLDPNQSVEMVTWERKPSALAEAFRSTLMSILFANQNGSRPRVIVLTSPNPKEGKSTVVSNLAIAVAEVGHRVLIIDADLRRPRLHQIYGVANAPGLTHLLKSPTPAEGDPLPDCIRGSSIPGLFLLTAGEATSAATSLLYGDRMKPLLKFFRSHFDTIIIDTPPMLQIPDARVLGRLSDRVIIVVRARSTTRDAAQAAYQRFREDGIPVLGVILNDWNPKHSPYGYYGYYNGYYKVYEHYQATTNS